MKKNKKAVIILCICFLICVCSAGMISANSEYKGIDVSVWQGDINFKEVKKDGIEAVYIRAGQGSNYTDTKFERNYKEAKKEDLKIGFYHYVTARNTRQAREQAHFFYSLIKNKDQQLRPAMDFEQLDGLSKKECNDIAKVYMETLENLLGYKPAFYSNAYDVQTVWEKDLNKYPLWIADYGVRSPYTTGEWSKWSGFQYSSRGDVKGISGHVDMDRFKEEILITDEEKNKQKEYITYTVKDGDTLKEIAEKYNTTKDALIKLNHLELIHPGEKLLIKK
ncbi:MULTISPECIES: GH25 family lysozyme [Anaerofustis]|uniref:GH25 family lysozyme n=1 Tax=Anaerofustis TaxID=264995 RepID=UPI001105BC62|nr:MULTISPECIES: GH25 family lysozyme [Anaerofustis]MCO8193805.1 LysM peptidoglycan-binding domain-containing protein [Anaerofustis sp. NSJ-163]